jgi:hypothetical protein
MLLDARATTLTSDIQPGAGHPDPSGMVRLNRIRSGQQGRKRIGRSE